MDSQQPQQVDPALSDVLKNANLPLITPQEDQAQVARAVQPAATQGAPAAAPASGAPAGAQSAQGAQPGGTTPAPATAPTTPAAPAAAPQTKMQELEQGSKHVLGDIFQTLAGGKQKVWQQTPNGPVATYVPLKPGQIAQGILSAAIVGLANGYDPKNRGKGGPAMSSAFSAGFKGEQEQRDKQADQKEQEAQKQFANKNISDEMALRTHKAATEQQEAVSRMQRDMVETQEIQQRAAEGKTVFEEGQADRIVNQTAAFNNAKTAGWTEIPHPVNPNEDFGFADPKEAQEYANKYASHLLRPGDFNTAPIKDPSTGLWVPMVQPKGYDELKQWRFTKMENGQPVKDPKNPGKYLSDGSKDATGRTMTPSEMTNKDYEGWLNGDSKIRMDKATATEKYAQAAELIARQQKDKLLAQADSRYADAGGDPFSVNIKDGTWTMTDGDRSRLRNAAVSNLAGMEKAREAAQKEIENGGTAEQVTAARELFKRADDQWNYYSKQLSELNGRISKSGSLANAYGREYTDENGYDGKKALDAFDAAVKRGDYKVSGLTPEELARVRGNLLSAQMKSEAAKKSKTEGNAPATATGDPNKLTALQNPATMTASKNHLQTLLTSGKSVADVVNEINSSSSFGPGDKKFLINEVNESAGLNAVRPGMTVMKNAQGKQINVSDNDTKQFIDMGYHIVGQSTQSVPQVSTEPEREK